MIKIPSSSRYRSIKETWELYQVVALQNAPKEVVKLIKLAFYTGAATVFDTLMLISQDEVSETSGINILEAMRKEFAEFTSEDAEFTSEERKSKES